MVVRPVCALIVVTPCDGLDRNTIAQGAQATCARVVTLRGPQIVLEDDPAGALALTEPMHRVRNARLITQWTLFCTTFPHRALRSRCTS